MSESLVKKIIIAISYFDKINYPVSLIELQRWLDCSATMSEIYLALQSDELQQKIECYRGFYFLKGNSHLVKKRLIRYRVASYKFKLVRKIVKCLKFFPWVKAIAIYSSLSFFNTQADGDLDFFIITTRRRIWSCRFFINIILKIFSLRPNENNKRDKICVSFWIDQSNLNLQSLTVNKRHQKLVYGTGQFIFVYDRNNLEHKFWQANSWLSRELPQWQPFNASEELVNNNCWHKWWQLNIEEILFFIPERLLKQIQMWILPLRYKTKMNKSCSVVINDKMIKLHDNEISTN